jgi:hypothetical protein
MPAVTWWKPDQKLGESRYFEAADPRRGSFGAQCHHLTCSRNGANWYNKLNCRYYCEQCAQSINADCEKNGLTVVCALHQ